MKVDHADDRRRRMQYLARLQGYKCLVHDCEKTATNASPLTGYRYCVEHFEERVMGLDFYAL